MVGNPYLDQFLMFYSQSEAGNWLTRGLVSDLAKGTYVQTKLDTDLLPDILAKKYRVIILTGNAGDGKTAFIQKVEDAAKAQGAILTATDSLGHTFTLQGRGFRTLYDGSVDSSGKSNHDILVEFFRDFAGDQAPDADICLLLAMNEGKLRDFLLKATGHRWLCRTFIDHLNGKSDLPSDMVLVNLNLRSLVDARTELTNSIFDKILDRYVAEEFWKSCEQCDCRHRCPVKFNVDTFRIRSIDGLEGPDKKQTEERNAVANTARVRLKSLFQILHFRKRLHITVRDLRSILAFALFGKRTCAQIKAVIESETADFTGSYYYNALFDPTEKDRVIGLLREFDVGLAVTPNRDSQLSFTRPETPDFRALFMDFSDTRYASRDRARIDEEDLLRLYKQRPKGPEERSPTNIQAAQRYVAYTRRKFYFEGAIEGTATAPSILEELIPYENLRPFISFLDSGSDPSAALKKALILAISRSESIFDSQRGQENICIRIRHDVNDKVKAFYTYPASYFVLGLPLAGTQGSYVEFTPSSILLSQHDGAVTLEISLDLYEMLMRIRDGYVPTAGEMRAFFLNLLMFKKQLMSTPSDRLLLTETDYSLFELKRTPQLGLELSSI